MHIHTHTQVITPNIFNVDLWKTSGHYAHYKDDMFLMVRMCVVSLVSVIGVVL
jgi:threonyl-tRNA synthetase